MLLKVMQNFPAADAQEVTTTLERLKTRGITVKNQGIREMNQLRKMDVDEMKKFLKKAREDEKSCSDLSFRDLVVPMSQFMNCNMTQYEDMMTTTEEEGSREMRHLAFEITDKYGCASEAFWDDDSAWLTELAGAENESTVRRFLDILLEPVVRCTKKKWRFDVDVHQRNSDPKLVPRGKAEIRHFHRCRHACDGGGGQTAKDIQSRRTGPACN